MYIHFCIHIQNENSCCIYIIILSYNETEAKCSRNEEQTVVSLLLQRNFPLIEFHFL